MEVERGKKAIEYHLYALAALTTVAEIGVRNGHDLYAECGKALGRTVAFTFDALAEPRKMESLAGIAQDQPQTYLTATKLVFIEPWLARHPGDRGRVDALVARRPLALTDLGGDQTLLYGGRRSQ
jgi:poly(beta-D-mannuronate) lyase